MRSIKNLLIVDVIYVILAALLIVGCTTGYVVRKEFRSGGSALSVTPKITDPNTIMLYIKLKDTTKRFMVVIEDDNGFRWPYNVPEDVYNDLDHGDYTTLDNVVILDDLMLTDIIKENIIR